jgi:hypothetical protein
MVELSCACLRRRDLLLAEHPLYGAPGKSAAVRQTAYRALFTDALDDGFVEALRGMTFSGRRCPC